jgi:E3 ubiquitin-protein ligase UBR3
VHVSVQLFSNEELASQMTEELRLLHVMVVSLRDMMSKILTPSTLQGINSADKFIFGIMSHVFS